ncbi:MAG: hypothetical protein WD646_09075 [Actinomycetota bacterium]
MLGVALLLVVSACGNDPVDPGTPAPDRTPGSGTMPTAPPEGGVNRPQTGLYVYELTSTGETEVPAGTKITIDVSADGDLFTTLQTNNRNSNTAAVKEQWDANRVLRISTTVKVGDDEGVCVFEPSVETIRIPLKVEVYPDQEWSGENCEGTTTIRVTRQQNVEDAGGRVWPTWKIEEKTMGESRTHLVRFFSPALGVDIRTEDRRNLTISVLSSNP